MKTVKVILYLVVLVSLSACAGGGKEAGLSGNSSGLTWTKGIRSIMEARCTECHYDGNGLGLPGDIPVWTDIANNIDGAQTVANKAQSIKDHLISGEMPMDNNFTNMTDVERQLVIDWIDGGMFL